MPRDPIVIAFIVLLVIVGAALVGVASIISMAVFGEAKYVGGVMIVMIATAMLVGKIFVNWASGSKG
jgi:hypothetical protein